LHYNRMNILRVMQENKSVFVHFFRRATNSTSVSCIHPYVLVM
jgi:hypothetical protein